MSHPAYIYPAFSHMNCLVLKISLSRTWSARYSTVATSASQTATPVSPGRGGARRGGGCAGCLWTRERYAMRPKRVAQKRKTRLARGPRRPATPHGQRIVVGAGLHPDRLPRRWQNDAAAPPPHGEARATHRRHPKRALGDVWARGASRISSPCCPAPCTGDCTSPACLCQPATSVPSQPSRSLHCAAAAPR